MVITDPDCGEIICSNCGMVDFQTKYKKVADQKSVLSIAQTEIIETEQAFLLL